MLDLSFNEEATTLPPAGQNSMQLILFKISSEHLFKLYYLGNHSNAFFISNYEERVLVQFRSSACMY